MSPRLQRVNLNNLGMGFGVNLKIRLMVDNNLASTIIINYQVQNCIYSETSDKGDFKRTNLPTMDEPISIHSIETHL